ncbi:hypothetical protein DFA_11284 [Cavenderia fasciculata]|uniref:BAR domain-containing protein n=1 Tax=Cavenderia fasciculata TaxID=261658 RepID=F4QC36_CACFS|nr:uncharacterized protein DFA_11284 [Cavenderia fasciculata]EGG13523.1 hypothetical protein DFA_11284 [Cavenderia fasciculata]|eukprot:XP_004350227.1 hypothetical protein DFA_11284 [Cavenderia fasciculata]
MFKKGLDVLKQTKEAVKEGFVENPDEEEHITNAKINLKNMKWSLKLLTELSRSYYLTSDKQVQQGNGLATILNRFGEKTSHTNYTENQTVPLSTSLKEVAAGINDTSLLFQQYTQLFADRLATQITALYEGEVKKTINAEKGQEELRAKFNVAASNLRSAQKSNKQVAERQSEYDNAKSLYDQSSANFVQLVFDTIQYVQKEVALSMKQFVQDQTRFIQEGIRVWTDAENKIFGVESPAAASTPQQYQQQYEQQQLQQHQTTFSLEPVSLSKLTIDESSPPYQPPAGDTPSPQYHSPSGEPNPFDDANPFEPTL